MGADPKAVVRRCFKDVIERGHIPVVNEVIDEHLVFNTATGAVLRGRREFAHFAEQLREAFPDIAFEIEAEVAEGELVCTRYTMSGTFEGTLMGLLPNGERFSVRGIDTFRVVGGKVVEIHASYDTLGQLQQLGAVPKL